MDEDAAEIAARQMNRAMVGLIGRETGVEGVRDHLQAMADLEAGIAERRRQEVDRLIEAQATE